MSQFNRKVERLADSAQRAERQNNQSNGDSAISAYMRRMFGTGARSPARSTAEAWGRGAQTFLLPLIAQGIQTWKDHYDARGDFKAGGRDYLDKMLRGEKLNPYQQSVLDNYQKSYPEEYAAALEAARQAQQAQQTTPQQTPAAQGAALPPPPEGINREGILGAIRANIPAPAQDEPVASYTGEELVKSAPSAQDIMAEAFRQDELNRILNPHLFGRW